MSDCYKPWLDKNNVDEKKIQQEQQIDQIIQGPDFDKILNFDEVIKQMKWMGDESLNLQKSIQEVEKMIKWRLSDEEFNENENDEYRDQEKRKNTRCTIFLGFSGVNMQTGVREIIKYLVENKMIDCIVCDELGVEEDMKRSLQMNDEEVVGWLCKMLGGERERMDGGSMSGGQLVKIIGRSLGSDSVLNQAWKNEIMVIVPGIVEGLVGHALYLLNNQYINHHHHHPLILDINPDMLLIVKLAIKAKKSGSIILGGGVIKHHILNSNIWRNGLDYAVFINTAFDFDASDSGAQISEAITWGKVKQQTQYTKIFADPTLVFPILVYSTFYKLKHLAKRN